MDPNPYQHIHLQVSASICTVIIPFLFDNVIRHVAISLI